MNANATENYSAENEQEEVELVRDPDKKTPWIVKFRIKYLSWRFLKKAIWVLFRYVLLIGISYIILFPFFSKIAGSFMSMEDFSDVTVRYIPRHPTLDTYRAIISENGYWSALWHTLLLSGMCGIVQTLICSLVGYGFAKFKFKGSRILFILVILTMIVPHQTLELSIFMQFRYFDVLGILNFLSGGVLTDISILPSSMSSINLINTYWPFLILSITGLAFKNGLYIFMMRQFYRGVPDELEESAYVDGAGVMRTFFRIIMPLSVPMMVTVFLFAFSWQWTDMFYTNLFFTSAGATLMPDIITVPASLATTGAGSDLFQPAVLQTCGLLIIIPLIIIYIFGQRYLVQGIERSGIVG